MSSFTYPGKARLLPKLRRFAGGMLLTIALIGVITIVKSRLNDKEFVALLALMHLSKEQVDELIAYNWISLVIFMALSWLFSKLTVIEVLEFHLFPWFDKITLVAVSEKTGLLQWVDFSDSEAHETACRLRTFLSEGVHNGAWLIGWIVQGRPALEKAFSYALLLGPNGVGKSQLAREVARERLGIRLRYRALAPRDSALAGSCNALVRWLRRVLPRMARLPDDPWHVGEITPLGDWSEQLKTWRPSAPTVLILDDPVGAMAREAIDILSNNCGQFWYSVKLVIIDQFTPFKLELEPIGRAWCDHRNREILILSLPEVRWTGEQVRRAFSGGVRIRDIATGKLKFDLANDVPEFWDAKRLELLSRALDGNPMMLAEAAVWLAARNAWGRPYRTIQELLSLSDPEKFESEAFENDISIDRRSEVAHRILKERVDDVFRSHAAWAKEMLLDQMAITEALCCASLAGGIPYLTFEVFSAVQGSQLEKWVVRDLANTAMLPPVGSWLISEAFIERGLNDYRSLKFEALVRRALAVNPVGLARQLVRRGRLARRLFEEVVRLENDAGAASSFALNLFEIAAVRAIWADREAAPHALAALETLPVADLGQAQAELENLGAFKGRVPDMLVAALLMTVLGSRRFVEHTNWDWRAWETFHTLWTRWLQKGGEQIDFVPLHLLDTAILASKKLYEAFFVEIGKLNEPSSAFKYLSGALERAVSRMMLQAIELRDEQMGSGWPIVFRGLFVLKAISMDDQAIKADGQSVLRRFEAIAASTRLCLPVEADTQQIAFVDAFILARQGKFNADKIDDREAISIKIETHAKKFPHDPSFARRQLFHMACILKEMPLTNYNENIAWMQAEKAEIISKSFLEDEICIELLIWCWSYAIRFLDTKNDNLLFSIIERMQKYISIYPNNNNLKIVLMTIFSQRITVLSQIDGQEIMRVRMLELISEIEASARQMPDFADMQWVRANAWNMLTSSWSKDVKHGIKIAEIAQYIEESATPFPSHLGIQSNRLSIWRNLAEYESRYGVSPDEAERIARRITWAAKTFRGDQSVSSVVVAAWDAAVFGWHRDLRASVLCERALRQLEAWLADNPPLSDGAVAQLSSWSSLLSVHRKRRDFDSLLRLEPEALARAEEARLAHPIDPVIAEWVGLIFAEAALSRGDRSGDRVAIEEMAARIHTLMVKFPLSKNIQENTALVDNLISKKLTKNGSPVNYFRLDAPLSVSVNKKGTAFSVSLHRPEKR